MWVASASVPDAARQLYERQLAERSDRRKRRRGGAGLRDDLLHSDISDLNPEDAAYLDTAEPALRPQPEEQKSCGIDKTSMVVHRRYGGLLIATLPCGRVCSLTPLSHAESLTQVYSLMSQLVLVPEHPIQYIMYDNACALARYSRHPCRRDRTPAAAAMAALTYVLDSFHQANHTACLDSSHPLYMPEVLRSRHSQLNGVNSQTAEQFFAWMDAFVGFASNMAPYVFRVFTMLLAARGAAGASQTASPTPTPRNTNTCAECFFGFYCCRCCRAHCIFSCSCTACRYGPHPAQSPRRWLTRPPCGIAALRGCPRL